MTEEKEVLEFELTPIYERYYNDESNYGVFNFVTNDNIPKYSDYEDTFNNKHLKTSSIVGKMQKLYLGSKYKVRAICEYNTKYSTYQYTPLSIIALIPKTFDNQVLFIKSIVKNTNTANNLLEEYPDVIDRVMNGELENIEYSKVKGIGKITWDKIRNAIIDNYIISDIIIMLQPLGVTYNMIRKLCDSESNPAILKKKLIENPYIMTKIKGLGFSRVDDLALKLNPALKDSMFRIIAFITYYLTEIGSNDGHTWIHKEVLREKINNNVGECSHFYKDIIENEIEDDSYFLHIENERVGLQYYYDIEKRIFKILEDKAKNYNKRFVFTEEEINNSIKKVEEEQGFSYTKEQYDVINKAIENDLIIISGKAGSGKTSIAKGIFQIYKDKEFSITACALSAKAAQRIQEATGHNASTIHRCLGAIGLNKFTYNYENPLISDVIFLDEASMVNAQLFYDLLCAVDIKSRIIISGDNMQLPPIGYGNIFSDILNRTDKYQSYQLTKPMRQAEMSGILADANLIRDGISPLDYPEPIIIHGELQDMFYMFRENSVALRDIAIKTFVKSIKNDGLDEVVIAVPRRNKCINSAQEINTIIQDMLLPDQNKSIRYGLIEYRLGAKVMQIVNNYSKNVFNGEIGYITNIGTEFENGKEIATCDITFHNLDGKDKVIPYKKSNLSEINLAYAMTVHKLQGSGYKTVIGIIDSSHYTLLDNCMLYTMITRAKKRCLLLSEPNAFNKCIVTNHNIARQTWLKDIKN